MSVSGESLVARPQFRFGWQMLHERRFAAVVLMHNPIATKAGFLCRDTIWGRDFWNAAMTHGLPDYVEAKAFLLSI